jgi:endonuclease YncB( thermonuclease family)
MSPLPHSPHGSDRGRKAFAVAAASSTALALVLLAATPANAAKLRVNGDAEVLSVDGPGRLTVKTKARSALKLRLAEVDAPQLATSTAPAECGAAEGVAALKRLVAKPVKGMRYHLLPFPDNNHFERDSEGRYYASITTPRKGSTDGVGLGSRLVSAGWARSGWSMPLNSVAIEHGYNHTDGDAGESDPAAPGSALRGVWASCGGRMHLPVGQAVPATATAMWSVDANGITQAIGPLALSPVLSPSSTLTIGAVAAQLGGAEASQWGRMCWVDFPALQIGLLGGLSDEDGVKPTETCEQSAVLLISTNGPGLIRTDRGLTGSDTIAKAVALFPRLNPKADSESLALSGKDYRPWAWQTRASVSYKGKIDELWTYAATEADR